MSFWNVSFQNEILQSVIILNVILSSVTMLNVSAPSEGLNRARWPDWAIFQAPFCRLNKEIAQKWQYLGLQIDYIFT
jgi:hypothetical protein